MRSCRSDPPVVSTVPSSRSSGRRRPAAVATPSQVAATRRNPAAKQYAMAHTDHAVVIGARIWRTVRGARIAASIHIGWAGSVRSYRNC